MKRLLILVPFLLTVLANPTQARAGLITTLYNTGTAMPDGSVDPHYSLITGDSTNAFVANQNTLPISTGDWLADSALSKWIGPLANQSTLLESNGADGLYIYRTTFDLTGDNPSTAAITGQWATDNTGLDILLNGVSTGITNISQFNKFSPFTITSGFVAGINTLDFEVYNIPFPSGSPSAGGTNPSGLRVEMSGTATAVPAPPTLVLLAVGVVTLLGWRKCRK